MDFKEIIKTDKLYNFYVGFKLSQYSLSDEQREHLAGLYDVRNGSVYITVAEVRELYLYSQGDEYRLIYKLIDGGHGRLYYIDTWPNYIPANCTENTLITLMCSDNFEKVSSYHFIYDDSRKVYAEAEIKIRA